ncbi:MAG: hypothetical protein EA427_06800 [Spirochaetaceae bacterium]|nr:MAG: hypothetical protein EA427_06800 [Spirochaetaceae bacterium]
MIDDWLRDRRGRDTIADGQITNRAMPRKHKRTTPTLPLRGFAYGKTFYIDESRTLYEMYVLGII